MKRLISVLCILATLATFAVVSVSADGTDDKYVISDTEGADKTATDTYCYGYIGDTDGNDSINIKDATTIQKYLANLIMLKDTNLILADTDKSEKVNIKDATTIQKWLAGIDENAPVYHLLCDKVLGKEEHVHSYSINAQTATCISEGYVQYTCLCGEEYKSNEVPKSNHSWGEWNAISEPTTEYYGEYRSQCKDCGYAKFMIKDKIRSDEFDNPDPYFVSAEFVSDSRPNTFYINGIDALTRIYGNEYYNTYQRGDTIIYQINMSDGGNEGFKIAHTINCDARIEGNKVIIKAGDAEGRYAYVKITARTKKDDELDEGISNIEICSFQMYGSYNRPLINSAQFLLQEYARKIELNYIHSGYVNPDAISKVIYFKDNPDWFTEAIAFMDELKAQGCPAFTFGIDSNGCHFGADKTPE